MSKETQGTADPAETPARYRLRGLRPLFWWLLFVLILFLLHTHEQLLEGTRLKFSVSMQGRSLAFDAYTALDAKPMSAGDRIGLGWHTFTVRHPNADSFSTNLFIWYGAHDLGEIVLQRSIGILALDVHPPASVLEIRGPEFSKTLTNSTGLTVTVPTDVYSIEANYAHWRHRDEVQVFADRTNHHGILPRLGALQLSCNQHDANFQLLTLEDGLVQGGTFPATVSELPQGAFKLVAQHHRNKREKVLDVKNGETNAVTVEFVYGGVVIETEPAGAVVSTDDGTTWGTTPLSFSEVPVGTWSLNVHREGYEPVRVGLRVAEHETATFRTNLVGRNFAAALQVAKQYMAEAKYDRALEAVKDALAAKRGDPEATELQRQAMGLGKLSRAEASGRDGNYGAAITELESALKLLPDNARAQALLPDFRQREAAQAEEARRIEAAAKRERRPREYFAEWMKGTLNSGLFDQQEVKVKGSLAEIQDRLVRALTNEKPAFKLQMQESPEPDLFRMRAMLALGAGGWRRCDMVGGQTGEGEVNLIFKVFEYAYPEALSIRALIGANDEKDMLPIHPSRLSAQKTYLLKRREEGIHQVRDRIRESSQQ